MKSESTHHDSTFTPTVRGAWFAPTREHKHDYVGAEFAGYRVTRKQKSANHTASWELTCQKCQRTRSASTTEIRLGLEGGEKQRVTPCRCKEVGFRSEAVKDAFGVGVEDLRIALAVIAHERVNSGAGPSRLGLEAIVKTHASTAALVRKGWLVTSGRPMVLNSTPRCRAALGFELTTSNEAAAAETVTRC